MQLVYYLQYFFLQLPSQVIVYQYVIDLLLEILSKKNDIFMHNTQIFSIFALAYSRQSLVIH